MADARIAACLIAGASAAGTIARCLSSVLPHVDEVDVFDTGLDSTALDSLASLSAHEATPVYLHQGTWRDDFAWARQQSFELATSTMDWLIWLDADDVLRGDATLHQVIGAAEHECDGFALLYEYAHDEDDNPVSVLWRERLVRRDRGYRWQGRVHEVLVTPATHGCLEPVDPARLRVVHRPSPEEWHPHRNLELLRLEERRDTSDGVSSRTLVYLAGELAWRGDFDEAVHYLRVYLGETEGSSTEERLEAVERLSLCLRGAGRAREGLMVAERALGEYGGESLPLVVAAQEAAVVLGDWTAAEAHAARALELDLPSSLRVSFDPTGARVLPAVRVAQASVRRGDFDRAQAVLDEAARLVRNGAAVATVRRRMIEAVAADDLRGAEQALGELAGRYDAVLHAVVRGLRLQAERVTVSHAGPNAHA